MAVVVNITLLEGAAELHAVEVAVLRLVLPDRRFEGAVADGVSGFVLIAHWSVSFLCLWTMSNRQHGNEGDTPARQIAGVGAGRSPATSG